MKKETTRDSPGWLDPDPSECTAGESSGSNRSSPRDVDPRGISRELTLIFHEAGFVESGSMEGEQEFRLAETLDEVFRELSAEAMSSKGPVFQDRTQPSARAQPTFRKNHNL